MSRDDRFENCFEIVLWKILIAGKIIICHSLRIYIYIFMYRRICALFPPIDNGRLGVSFFVPRCSERSIHTETEARAKIEFTLVHARATQRNVT